jgi:hypothetical protein
MNTIINEFNGSIERIINNFYFSFLSLNFVNQRPFLIDIVLPANLTLNILKADSINNFDRDGIREYGNSIRRHFLNDIVIVYERYAMLMIASHQNGNVRTEPASQNNRNIGAHLFGQLPNLFTPNELLFLIQLRRLRNSIVHYNGHYSVTNELDYTFGTDVYKSIGNEGEKITIEFDNVIWIYNELKRIVLSGDSNYFIHNSLL